MAASRATQDDLHAILRSIPAMIGYWDRDLRNRLANDAYVDFFGVDPAHMHGMHISELLGPDLYAQNRPYMERALAGDAQLFDREIPTPSGEVRYTQASYVPDTVDGEVRGFFVLVTDITARRRAEIALAEAERRFRTLFDSAPIGTLITGPDGRIVDLNDAVTEVMRRPREELMGVTVLDITHPDDRFETAARYDRLLAGELESFRTEQRFVTVAGDTIWAQVDGTLLQTGEQLRVLEQIQDISERHRHEERLAHLADHDALTGLLNRRAMARELDRLKASAERYGADGALVLIDLDNFKHVNDTLGHKAGDELLVDIADMLRSRVRATDIVARLGGDEFAILIPRGGSAEAARLARTLVAMLHERPGIPGTHGVRVTASIGVAELAAGETGEELLMHADLAMYDAKDAGRDRVSRYADTASGRPRMESRLRWQARIRAALANDGLRLMSQPIADPRTGAVVAHELLVRMLGDEGELITPDTFLYVAEHFDLIQEIDEWVLGQACDLLGVARRAGDEFALSVNVSGRSLGADGLTRCLEESLARTGIDPRNLILEITETSTVSNIQRARDFARTVREFGCRLAIDDFGVGFGSFYYLKHLPFDLLKIDGEFVTAAHVNSADALIVTTVRDLAHGMSAQVVAEFCCDQANYDWLAANGIDLVQGYHLGPPALIRAGLLPRA